jgi:hypothetical protein
MPVGETCGERSSSTLPSPSRARSSSGASSKQCCGRGSRKPATNFVEAGFELDVYWPGHRFAVELDSYATHSTVAAFERDHLRDEDLMLAGIEMIRVTDVRFHREPEAVLERIATLLARVV